MVIDFPRWQCWVQAARLRTLPASLAPILLGNALAYAEGHWQWSVALACLACALCLQLAVNLANDYFDGIHGVDTDDRLGPPRVTQQGLIPPTAVYQGMWVCLTLAAVLGLWLVYVGGGWLLLIGALAVLAALSYSGGPWPLASHGLGDITVFVFFGLVAVMGSYYLQAGEVSWLALLFACAAGGPITAILVVNNIRDMDTDAAVGKRTLAVRIGLTNSRFEYTLLVLSPLLSMMSAYKLGMIDIYPLWATFALLPITLVLISQVYYLKGRLLNGLLAKTSLYSLALAILLAIAING